MTLISNRCDPNRTENNSHIALLSHTRKCIDSVLDIAIFVKYSFPDGQVGIKGNMSTGTAIPGYITQSAEQMYMAILNLNATFDSVPRSKVVNHYEECLRANVTAVVKDTFHPVHTLTSRCGRSQTHTIDTGMLQGSRRALH